jgi:hypothetical protein
MTRGEPVKTSTWIIAVLAATAICRAAPAAEAQHADHAAQAVGVAALSAPLREALAQEMVALQNGMMTIVPAFASGNWALVAETGRQMEQSYIMKQALSAEQLDELHHLLPPQFLELDAQFHYLAGMLSHAADNRKPELAAFYFSRMLETCTACHARFATEKFPALAVPEDAQTHDHHH